MIGWRTKATIQRWISYLPYPYYWYGLVQRYITRTLEIRESGAESRLVACRRHMDDLAAHASIASGFSVLDIGTGWLPVIPLGLWLCGADRIRTFDITSLLDKGRLRRCVEILRDFHARGRLTELLPAARLQRIEQLFAALPKLDDLGCAAWLEEFSIGLVVGRDNLKSLRDERFDLIVSYEVLEYVPAAELDELVAFWAAVSRPGTVMSHLIDLTDEYSYFDPSISALNFLQYSDREWARRTNPLFPLNRLRLPAYRAAFAQHGFTAATEDVKRVTAESAAHLSLDPQFASLTQDDVLVTFAWLRNVKQ